MFFCQMLADGRFDHQGSRLPRCPHVACSTHVAHVLFHGDGGEEVEHGGGPAAPRQVSTISQHPHLYLIYWTL